MRTWARLLAVGMLGWSIQALADPNDFRIEQLGNPGADPNSAANARFATFTREFAAALTSTNLTPPGTLGHAGFSVTAELSMAFLKGSSSLPTSGANAFQIPTQRPFDNTSPLLLPSIHVRKGLPFSFELGMRTTYIDKTNMGAALGEVRWAVNEGFAYLPDICVRGYGMRLFNTRNFDLGAAGLDLGIGKRFAVGGMVTLAPYAGWNLVWVGAGSHTIDFDPGRTYAQSVGTPYAQLTENTGTYANVSSSHNRFYAGLRFGVGVLQLSAELSYSLFGQVGTGSAAIQPPALLTVNTMLGLDF